MLKHLEIRKRILIMKNKILNYVPFNSSLRIFTDGLRTYSFVKIWIKSLFDLILMKPLILAYNSF